MSDTAALNRKDVKKNGSKPQAPANRIFETQAAEEKKSLRRIIESFNEQRKKIAGEFGLDKAADFLKEEKKAYDRKADGLSDRAKLELRLDVARNAIKLFPALNQMAWLNNRQAVQIQNSLNVGSAAGVFDRNVLNNLDVAFPESLFDWTVLRPPFRLSDSNISEAFDEDNSFPWADWGTLHQSARLSNSHSWTDFSGSSYEYADGSVGIGTPFRMPTHGELEVSIVLWNLDNKFTYSLENNWGPSSASLGMCNMIFGHVFLPGNPQPLGGDSAHVYHQDRSSDGGEISESVSPIPANAPVIVNFRTGHIHEGTDLEIWASSWFRAYSSLTCMDATLKGSLIWKVEKIYVRVV
jgi:hypothetical protein